MNTRLSIITSTLNAERDMEDTLDSMLPIPDGVEWICIDGGSYDNTVPMMSSYAYVYVYNGCSLYGGFNWGLKHSVGDYVVFLNSGDRMLSQDILEGLVRHLDGGKDCYYFDALLDSGNKFPQRALENIPYYMPFSHQGCAMKLDTIKKMGLFSEHSGPTADHELIVKMWLSGCSFEKLDLCLIQCAPFTSTEDDLGRLLNRWRNTRNVYKKLRPDNTQALDYRYRQMLANI